MRDPNRKRRWLKHLVVGVLLLAALVAIPVAGIETMCRAPFSPMAAGDAAPSVSLPPITEAGYKRNEAWTYFTFPEWYIVYSFEDFGKFLDTGNESAFPYAGHIMGFWRSFCTINRIGAGRPEPLTEVKVMIYTIGISYSVELAIKGAYENTLGRLFEWVRGPQRTPEDVFARTVAQDYAASLYTVPWYKYPFLEKLQNLWATAGGATPSAPRSIERKLALSAEYGVKSGYAWVIQKALDASSQPAALEIMLVVRTLPPELLAKEPRIKILRALGTEHQLIVVPRYKDFTEIVRMLARENQKIVEIAGNGDIMMTVVLADGVNPAVADARELFSLPLGARPGFRRAGFDVKVERLTAAVRAFETTGATVEHLYDY
jgi:hypothetical protein